MWDHADAEGEEGPQGGDRDPVVSASVTWAGTSRRIQGRARGDFVSAHGRLLVRLDDLSGAVAILAPQARIDWLGHPDCAAPSDDAAASEISGLVPDRAMVMASWDGDPHIDHERVAQLARHMAARRPDIALAFYPIWGRFGDRTAPGRLIHASGAARAAKAAALACHRTQMSALIDDDADGFVMEDWRQAHFLDHPEIVIAP